MPQSLKSSSTWFRLRDPSISNEDLAQGLESMGLEGARAGTDRPHLGQQPAIFYYEGYVIMIRVSDEEVAVFHTPFQAARKIMENFGDKFDPNAQSE